MKEFRVRLVDRPGELGRLTEVLAKKGVNIKALAAVVAGNEPVIGLVGDHDEEMRQALSEADYSFEEAELLSVSLNDKPGELARLTRRLADALVNIRSIYILAKAGTNVQFGLTVDNVQKARHALEQK